MDASKNQLSRKKTMTVAIPKGNILSILDKKRLENMKTKATRSGVWFRALRRIDRVLFDLTIRVTVTIRSSKLTKSILLIARKLEDAVKSSLSSRLREIGLPLAQKVSLTAQKLGNVLATDWASDSSFAFFLAAMHIDDNTQAFRR